MRRATPSRLATGQGAGQHHEGLPRPAPGGGAERDPRRRGSGFRPTPDHPGGSIDHLRGFTRLWRAREGRRRGGRLGRADVASFPASCRGRVPSATCTPGVGDGFPSFLRKEVIQPQVPLRLPCYDLVPITGFIFGACLAAPATSDAPRFGGLTGGVYKAQEHIHRGMLIRDY